MTNRRRFLGGATLATVLHRPLVAGGIPPTNPQTQGPKLRVGQIGTRHAHASGKLAAVRKLNDTFELVGVVEPDPDQRELVAKTPTYRDVNWLSDDDLLSRPVDLILVETEIDQLLATAKKCLLAGKHIHLDKPAGTSLVEFRNVVDLAKKNRLQLQMGYMFRSNPAFQFLFEAVRAGWLGEIFEVHAVMSKKVNSSSRIELARYQGGSMFELGCHLIDAVVYLMGKPESIASFNRQTQADGLFDNCLAVFGYPKATATIRSSVVEVEGNRRRQMVVCGTRGTIAIEPLEPPQLQLTLDADRGEFHKGRQVVELPTSTGRYDGDLLALTSAIRGDTPYEFSYQHDLDVQASVLSACGMTD